MKLFPYKLVKVSEGVSVKVSNHYYYSDFGIRDSSDSRYGGKRYIQEDTPGTGFMERDTESHSYHEFVRDMIREQKPHYWKMVTGREPDFDRELALAKKAIEECHDEYKRRILACYIDALTVGRREEYLQRVIRGIKARMGHHHNKHLSSIMSHYRNKISQMTHDIRAAEYRVKEHCSAETYEAYSRVVAAFSHVASCRRVWHYNDNRRERYMQVFFDMGIFDYIYNEGMLPLMRDSEGVRYYLLPDAVIVARGSLDFDIVPIKNMTIVSQELAIEEPTENLLTRIGDAASMIKIPELNLNFYFNHVHAIIDFVEAVDRLKATL